jgi:hypothetical protein
VAERKPETDADRALAFLHQFAGDVVDYGDMVGIDCVAQTKTISQQDSAEHHCLPAE